MSTALHMTGFVLQGPRQTLIYRSAPAARRHEDDERQDERQNITGDEGDVRGLRRRRLQAAAQEMCAQNRSHDLQQTRHWYTSRHSALGRVHTWRLLDRKKLFSQIKHWCFGYKLCFLLQWQQM